MGIKILSSHFIRNETFGEKDTVYSLAMEVVGNVISPDEEIEYFIGATACPDRLSPSLCQEVVAANPILRNTTYIDMVQGCTGGLTALKLAHDLLKGNQKAKALVLASDLAKYAVAPSNSMFDGFGNGAYAMVVEFDASSTFKSFQWQHSELKDVVTINIGQQIHNGDWSIKNPIDVEQSRDLWGLKFNNRLAAEFLLCAEKELDKYLSENKLDVDIIVPHHANPKFVNHIQSYFKSRNIDVFCDDSLKNTGSATVGIAYLKNQEQLKGKKVLLLGYGTGATVVGVLCEL